MSTTVAQIGNAPIAPDARGLQDKWVRFSIFLFIGYLCANRSFAYLGLPWIHAYIGEMSLAAFLLFGPLTTKGPWLRVARQVRRLKGVERMLLLLLGYGAFEAVRGIMKGYPALTAMRDTAFDYYPLFIFLGIWVGWRDGSFLRRAVRALAWTSGVYGLIYVLLLSWLPWTMPGTANAASKVPLFSEPSGACAVALLGLICFEPKLRQVWHLIFLNGFVLLGLQIRAEWVGFAVGALLFAWLTKRLKHVAMAGGLVVVLLGVMYVTNLSLLSPKGRGGNIGTRISADSLVARAIAPLSKNLAAQVGPVGETDFAINTTRWRLVWWIRIWERVNADTSSALLGLGYGFPIGELNPFITNGQFIQTPHNDFLYALGFTGWLGALLFVLFQFEIAKLLWRSYRITGQPFGIVCWSALLAAAMFEDFLEAPFGAIPFFLLVGAAIAPALMAGRPKQPSQGPA